MNTKIKTIFAATCLGLSCSQAQAASISFNLYDGDSQLNVAPGGLTRVASAATSGNDLLYTLTTTGDVDGLGISSDTLSIVVRQSRYDASGGAVAVTDVNNSLGGIPLTKGHTFTFEIDSITYTRGEGFTNATTFLGFTAVTMLGDQGGVIHSGTAGEYLGTQTAWSGTHASSASFGTVTGVASITNSPTSVANNTFFRNLAFSVDVDSSTVPIPEPSSTALLGLGAMALILRRRK